MTKKELRAEVIEILHLMSVAAMSVAGGFDDRSSVEAVGRLKALVVGEHGKPNPYGDACLVALGHFAKGTSEGWTIGCDILLGMVIPEGTVIPCGWEREATEAANDCPHGTGVSTPVDPVAKVDIVRLAGNPVATAPNPFDGKHSLHDVFENQKAQP